MTAERSVVVMPRLNANDDGGLLAAWARGPGEAVRIGDIIAQIETTKAAVDIESDAEGFIHPLVPAGTTVPVGEPIAWIVKDYDPVKLTALAGPTVAPTARGERLISRKAQSLMTTAGLQPGDIQGDGPIGTHDVEAALRARNLTQPAPLEKLAEISIKENSLVLFGAASQGDVVVDALGDRQSYLPLCFIDERPKQDRYANLPVFGPTALTALHQSGARLAHVCVGEPGAKLRIAAMLEAIGFQLVTIVHPRAIVSAAANLGKGVFIGPGAIVGPHADIGDFSQINNNATVPHHVRLGSAVRIADGANLGGGISVGDRSYIGLGVTINTGCDIGADVTVVSGVSVFNPVPSRTIVRPPKVRL